MQAAGATECAIDPALPILEDALDYPTMATCRGIVSNATTA